jgi:hypothetical protein
MRQQHQTEDRQRSRRDAIARVRGWKACVAMSQVGVVAMLGTLFTAKINPRWASGGLQIGGNP